MGRQGLLIGEVAARTGVSRKALRLYEAAGILSKPSRTPAGYRIYGEEALAVLQFVAQARRLGFGLPDIRDILAIKRSGGVPCSHVRARAQQKVAELDQKVRELVTLREGLRQVAAARRIRDHRGAAVCPYIEQPAQGKRRNVNGQSKSVALPRV